jgi:hypothetical protein
MGSHDPFEHLKHKVIGPQNRESLGRKWHLGVGFVAMPKVYYKGEGGGFPQVHAMVSLMNP